MKPAHPQQHPAGRTFGLTEEEIANIRRAAEKPLWRYILADRAFRPIVLAVVLGVIATQLIFDGHSGGSEALILFCLIYCIRVAASIYGWFSKRRLGRQLGYG